MAKHPNGDSMQCALLISSLAAALYLARLATHPVQASPNLIA